MEDLAAHGITMKPEMQGLTDEQIRDLNLGTSAKTWHCQYLPRLKGHEEEQENKTLYCILFQRCENLITLPPHTPLLR